MTPFQQVVDRLCKFTNKEMVCVFLMTAEECGLHHHALWVGEPSARNPLALAQQPLKGRLTQFRAVANRASQVRTSSRMAGTNSLQSGAALRTRAWWTMR